MDAEERQFLLTTAWFFARHGQVDRARTLCAALVEDNARDGIAAAALAAFQLDAGDPEAAMDTLSQARFPKALERAEALLETRTLQALGRSGAARHRWQRYVNSAKGKARTWA